MRKREHTLLGKGDKTAIFHWEVRESQSNFEHLRNDFFNNGIFTDSAPWPIQSISRNVRYNVCLPVHSWKLRFPVDWRLLVEERIAYIGILLDVLLFFGRFDNFLRSDLIRVLGSLWTSLLCIVAELTGGGSVAVAVGVSDRWQVTLDTWQVTHDTWHVTHDILSF